MVPKIHEAIDRAVAQGIDPKDAAKILISKGWPEQLVLETTKNWMVANGRLHDKSGFGDWIQRFTRQAKPYLIAIFFASLLVAAVSLLKPWPTKIMVDSAFGKIPAPGPLEQYTGTGQLILFTALMTLAIFAIATLFSSIRDYLLIKYSDRITKIVRQETFRHILNIPANKGALSKGDYIHRQNNLTGAVADYVFTSKASILQAIITIVGIIFVMQLIDRTLTVVTLFLVPFIFITTKLITPRVSRYGKRFTQNSSDISSIVTESIDNAETIQSFDMTDRQVAKASNLWEANFSLMKKSLLSGRLFHFTNNASVVLSIALVMYFGGNAALNGDITLGQLLIFMTYMGYLLGPVQTIANQFSIRKNKRLDSMRVHQALQDHEGIESQWNSRHFPFREGKIQFQNVNFSYGDYPVLRSLNLEIKPGQKVGIVGESGVGKSTLLKLLTLFLEPRGGKVLIDDIDIQSISIKELRSRVAIVNQSPQLFNTPIIENVLDGSPNHTIARDYLDYLLKELGITEFAKHLPDGLNTPAGENGSNLSGGQKQRVALARALAKQTPILCLDEPTSALDSNSERDIKQALAQLLQQKTVLLVSHRRTLLELMDIVYVLQDGILRNVEDFGGLEAYLAKVNDVESQISLQQTKLEEAQLLEKIQRDRHQALINELAQKNAQLQQKLSTTSQSVADETASLSDDGMTLTINH